MSKVKEIKFNENTRSFAGIREMHQKVFDFGWRSRNEAFSSKLQ